MKMFDIKTVRVYLGISQAELAKMVGVHQTAVSQWEIGTSQPSARVIPRILQALNCKFEDIYKEGVTNG